MVHFVYIKVGDFVFDKLSGKNGVVLLTQDKKHVNIKTDEGEVVKTYSHLLLKIVEPINKIKEREN